MTLDPTYFRDLYAACADPWGLAGRWYEARKYAVSTALLPRQRYGRAFEPGCSIGVLTAMLAPRCDALLACDAVPDAVSSARARTAGLPGVRVEQRAVPGQWPPGSFDLIVLSELLYYFEPAWDSTPAARGCAASRAPDRSAGTGPRPWLSTCRPARERAAGASRACVSRCLGR